MAEGSVQALTMPKWGLSMTEGKLLAWLVEEGATLARGDEVAEVETDKITGAVEAPFAGTLRRRVAPQGTVVPVGGLLGAVAEPSVADEEVEAFVAAFQERFATEGPAVDEHAEAPTLETPVGTLRYLVYGEGDEAVVFVHGFGGDLENWGFTAEPLADGRRTVVFDLPGHGDSVKAVEGEDPLATLRAALLGLLDGLELERADLVGHSLGGALALALAAEHPERVRSLTLVDPVGLGEEIDAGYLRGFVAARTRRELKPVVAMLFADESLVSRKLLDGLLKAKRMDGVQETLGRIADAVLDGDRQALDLRRALAEVSVPVLVLWGAQDRIVPAAQAEGLEGADVEVEVLAQAGHSPHMEAAKEVNARLERFLGRVRA
jgi:pyruvate dehydrogenase E2 component (dihydrolipoamide acetyltransferase)